MTDDAQAHPGVELYPAVAGIVEGTLAPGVSLGEMFAALSSSPRAALIALFPALELRTAPCPVSMRCAALRSADGLDELADVVIHLNDDHRWSRERIASWLESLPIDLTVQPTSSGH